ncbi:MAG: ATP-dependent DNA helicase RecG, partial [Planctomycetota bacterium]
MDQALDDPLSRPLQYLKGVGPARATLLKRLNIEKVHDLLLYFPVSHKDRASVTPIARLKSDEESNIVAQIIDVRGRRFGSKEKVEALLQDDTGQIRAVWWSPYVADKLTPNAWGFFSGKVTQYGGRRELSNSEFEIVSDAEDEAGPAAATGPSFGRIVPVYNLHPKQRLPSGEEAPEIHLTQAALRKCVWQALELGAAERLADQLPAGLRQSAQLQPLSEALHHIHFPESFESLAAARRRLVFEELFIVSLGVALRRAQVEHTAAATRLALAPAIEKRIHARLPFQLTPSQAKVFAEIAADMAGRHPMNRLLQGDVASGKTAVAVAALLLCVARGGQAAFLAPTEVLAEQHMRTLSEMLANSRVKLGLLRGGAGEAARREFLTQLAAGEIHIAIGTHALLEPDVAFKALALVIVDEQHKFGVAQRLRLRAKGRAPHVLVMTATPIPRTLTLTLYGDLDVSRIDEPPPGRGEIVTRLVKEAERPKVYRLIQEEAQKGNAAYVVLPRIDENESSTGVPPVARTSAPRLWSEVKGVGEELARLRAQLPTLRLDMLHGRMAGAEKDRVLALLRAGKLDVLVSTQVIEVGIDLPTATVMVIENAEMFGLSALHQLRGRVGRSGRKSYCLVFGQPASAGAKERLRIFARSRDGFEIAEADFALRGPGQFFGTQQSGLPELKIA